MTPSSLDRGGEVSAPDSDDEPVTDPRALVLPQVDTAIDLADGRLPFKLTLPTLLLGVPALVALCAGVWVAIQGAPLLGVGLMFVASFAAFGVALARFTSTWSIRPHERVLDAGAHLRRRASLPWGYDEAVAHAADLHAIEAVVTVDVGEREPTTYAGVRTHDGRVVVPLQLRGSNTEFLEPGELDRLAGTLTQGFDTEIPADTPPIGLHSTTRPHDSAAADVYRERARRGWLTRLSQYAAGLLGHVGEWVAERDEATGANDTEHYLFVTVRPGEDDVERRIEDAEQAIETAEYLDAEPLSAREAVNLAAEYWERSTFPGDDVGTSAAGAAVPAHGLEADPDREGPTAAERSLSPEWYAEHSRHVEVGDVVARTYWISSWPVEPSPKFLHGLQTMPGVDLDVTLYAHPRDRERTIKRLKRVISRIDAEGMERAENLSVDALTIDDDLSAYVLAFKLLREVDTQPWGLSGYVTVRAPDLERLEAAGDRVEKELRSSPTRCSPAAPFGDQHAAFRSAAPFAADYYAEKGTARHRAGRTHLALGGVFGAALPAATPEVSDPDGIRWGRDATTGRTIQYDPFGAERAGHLITVAPSGSGKTYSVKQATEEWWLAGDDRTLIYADTQGGFEDVVEAFDAEHILIDGKRGINPLDIRPAAEHDLAATDGGIDQYRLKVEEATEWLCGILRSHGVDPADYHAVAEQAVEQTFAEAGIGPDPETHDKPTPPPDALFETLERMLEEPGEFTFTDDPEEAEDLKTCVSALLRELSGFKEGGKFHNIREETIDGLDPETDLAYIDMRHLAGQTGGVHSANLQLVVSQVTQLIKQTEGETLLVLDEAHNLLNSPEMVDYLDKAVREWRRYSGALWFVTQSPRDFLDAVEGGPARETILEQATTRQIMNASGIDAAVLEAFGVPAGETRTVQRDLTPPSAGKDYAECVLSIDDEPGWIRTRVEASPLLDTSITFSHRSGETYRDRMLAALQEGEP